MPRRRSVLVQELQDRQHKGGGLARAGLSAGEHVSTLEHVWDGLGLDGRRLGVPLGRDGTKELGREPEGVE